MMFNKLTLNVTRVQENDENTTVAGTITGNGFEGKFQITGDHKLDDLRPGQTHDFNISNTPAVVSNTANSGEQSDGTQPNNTQAVSPTSSTDADHTGDVSSENKAKMDASAVADKPSDAGDSPSKTVGDKQGV